MKKPSLGALALLTGAATIVADIAFAGAPVPAPVAGAFGPVGLVVAGAAYVGYRVFKHFR